MRATLSGDGRGSAMDVFTVEGARVRADLRASRPRRREGLHYVNELAQNPQSRADGSALHPMALPAAPLPRPRTRNRGSRRRRRRAGGSTETLILRAVRVYFWTQAALGAQIISVRTVIAAPKSTLARLYSCLVLTLCFCDVLMIWNEFKYNSFSGTMLITLGMLMHLSSIGKYFILNIFINNDELQLFQSFTKFDRKFLLNWAINDLNPLLISKYNAARVVVFLISNLMIVAGHTSNTSDFKLTAIYLWQHIVLETRLLISYELVRMLAQRLEMMTAALESTYLANADAGIPGQPPTGVGRSPRVHVGTELPCDVTLDKVLDLYDSMQDILKQINYQLRFDMLLKVSLIILAALFFPFVFLTTKISSYDWYVSAIIITSSSAKYLIAVFLVCAGYEGLIRQHERLVSALIRISAMYRATHPERRRHARRLARALLSDPFKFSLYGLAEVRASFIPTLLSLLVGSVLMYVQFQ